MDHVHRFQNPQGQEHLIEYFDQDVLSLGKEHGFGIGVNEVKKGLLTELEDETHHIL